ncbi:antitoxin [Corynebacterium crudilactis]|uniref:Antitoxin n=1 Tax=Corynebacterium crudilactis TaxID=1652495 RepID=A0A172QSC8_9CORY|nr:antitoxin [Corynebacterium crudilactis]ANE03596.1 hypothetical protein ccrud_04785 [Corynebacterium crudilactis]
MGIFDNVTNKANDFLNSEAGEKKTDEILDKISDAARGRLGEDKADQINKVRDAVDERIGKTDSN